MNGVPTGAVPDPGAVVPAWLHLFLDVPARHWAAATRFWAAATGGTISAARGATGQFVTLLPAHGDPWVKLQRIDVPPTGGDAPGAPPPRTHLDLDGTDRTTAVAHATALGATAAWRYEGVVVMRSPGGLLLCNTLVTGRPALGRDADLVLDQVCIDIPASSWHRESRFWQALLGGDLVAGPRPEFAVLPGPPTRPRVLLHRLGEPAGPVRAHPDLACADRAAATARHTGLGAELVATHERWTVLRAPGGHLYCLTDRDPRTGRLPGPDEEVAG